MGLGMLFAGALTGGAKAVGELADDAIKQRERAEVRQQSIMDRRNELLFEMKAKSDMARRQEEEDAAGFGRIAKRGEQITNERGARELEGARSSVPMEGEFANDKITPDMIASMPPAARAIYEKEMGLTDDSSLQRSRDMVMASTEVSASPAVRKGILDSYREEFKADRDKRDQDFREKKEDNRREMDSKRLEATMKIATERNESQEKRAEMRAARGSGSGSSGGSEPKVRSTKTNADGEVIAVMSDGSTKPLGIQDQAFAKSVATMVAKMREDRRYRNETDEKLVEIVKQRLASSGVAKTDRADEAAAPKSTPQKSTVKDNPTTASAKPVEVKTKAAYDALPKGAKYVAPDGTVRTKG